jgi:hypothetical protein
MNNIEEAKSVLNMLYGEQTVPLDRANVHAQVSQAQALIAIAEQLRISNLIALANSGEVFNSADRAYQELENPEIVGVGILSRNIGSLRPDIAEALGIKESDHE